VWRSQLVLEDSVPPEASAFLLPLAVPLHRDAGIEIKGIGPAALRRDADGRVTALVIPSAALSTRERLRRRWTRTLHLVASAPLQTGEDVLLAPPLLRGDAVQRVSFSAGDEHSFEPALALEVVRHMTHLRTPEVSRDLRHDCDRMLERGLELPNPTTMYLTAGPRLVGTLASHQRQRQLVGMVVGIGGGFIVALLALAYRVLSRVAARDQGKRNMQRRFEELQEELAQVDGALRELEPEKGS
jgi:hypothetical protein